LRVVYWKPFVSVRRQSMRKPFPIEIIYASPEKHYVLNLMVAVGTTIREVLALSVATKAFPALDVVNVPVGVFGQIVRDDYVVCEGDRVEVYRPLQCDPKQARRLRAKQRTR